MDRRNARDLVLRRAHAEPGIHLLSYALGKIQSCNLVDGNNDRAAQQASEKCNHPLGAVLAPDENFVALCDLSRVQFASETMRVGQHLAIRPALHAIPAMMNVSHLPRVALEIIE